MPNMKKENKTKELHLKNNNTPINYNIAMMKIKDTKKEENLEMMKEVL